MSTSSDQSDAKRAARLARGGCPTHGLAMRVVQRYWPEGVQPYRTHNAVALDLECCRRDCEFRIHVEDTNPDWESICDGVEPGWRECWIRRHDPDLEELERQMAAERAEKAAAAQRKTLRLIRGGKK